MKKFLLGFLSFMFVFTLMGSGVYLYSLNDNSLQVSEEIEQGDNEEDNTGNTTDDTDEDEPISGQSSNFDLTIYVLARTSSTEYTTSSTSDGGTNNADTIANFSVYWIGDDGSYHDFEVLFGQGTLDYSARTGDTANDIDHAVQYIKYFYYHLYWLTDFDRYAYVVIDDKSSDYAFFGFSTSTSNTSSTSLMSDYGYAYIYGEGNATTSYDTAKDNCSSTVTGTFYAYFRKKYSVDYDANGGSSVSSTTFYAGVPGTVTSTIPTRTGYTFVGWNTNQHCLGDWYFAGDTVTIEEDMTLYAIWVENDVYWTAHCQASLTVGNGTQTSPFQISTAEQLATVAYLVNSNSSYASCYYELTADIDLSDYKWVPIGINYAFTGNFNGNGYSISGLTINCFSPKEPKYYNSDLYIGLFGKVSGATIQGVVLKNVSLMASFNQQHCNIYIGALAASVSSGTIKQIGILSGDITCSPSRNESYYFCVGGMIGTESSTISECFSYISITATTSHSSSDIDWAAGGLVAKMTSGTITNCYYVGSITGYYFGGCGGIVGYMTGSSARIVCCYSKATIKATSSSAAGGIVGYVYQYGYIFNSFSVCSVSGSSSNGKIAGYLGGKLYTSGSAPVGIVGCSWESSYLSEGTTSTYLYGTTYTIIITAAYGGAVYFRFSFDENSWWEEGTTVPLVFNFYGNCLSNSYFSWSISEVGSSDWYSSTWTLMDGNYNYLNSGYPVLSWSLKLITASDDPTQITNTITYTLNSSDLNTGETVTYTPSTGKYTNSSSTEVAGLYALIGMNVTAAYSLPTGRDANFTGWYWGDDSSGSLISTSQNPTFAVKTGEITSSSSYSLNLCAVFASINIYQINFVLVNYANNDYEIITAEEQIATVSYGSKSYTFNSSVNQYGDTSSIVVTINFSDTVSVTPYAGYAFFQLTGKLTTTSAETTLCTNMYSDEADYEGENRVKLGSRSIDGTLITSRILYFYFVPVIYYVDYTYGSTTTNSNAISVTNETKNKIGGSVYSSHSLYEIIGIYKDTENRTQYYASLNQSHSYGYVWSVYADSSCTKLLYSFEDVTTSYADSYYGYTNSTGVSTLGGASYSMLSYSKIKSAVSLSNTDYKISLYITRTAITYEYDFVSYADSFGSSGTFSRSSLGGTTTYSGSSSVSLSYESQEGSSVVQVCDGDGLTDLFTDSPTAGYYFYMRRLDVNGSNLYDSYGSLIESLYSSKITTSNIINTGSATKSYSYTLYNYYRIATYDVVIPEVSSITYGGNVASVSSFGSGVYCNAQVTLNNSSMTDFYKGDLLLAGNVMSYSFTFSPTEIDTYYNSDTGVFTLKDADGNFVDARLSFEISIESAANTQTGTRATLTGGVYYISSAQNLLWLSYQVGVGNTFSGTIFKQTADIDMDGITFTPIGTSTYAFAGTYNGNGYTIKNLTVSKGKSGIGFFGYTNGATIKNVTLVGGTVAGYGSVGSVVGSAINTTLKNVNNYSCKVTGKSADGFYDIYGNQVYASFDNYVNNALYNTDNLVYTDETSYNTWLTLIGFVGVDDSKYGAYFGGLVGYASGCTITICCNQVEVDTLQGSNAVEGVSLDIEENVVGGLVGYAEGSTKINQCYTNYLTLVYSDDGTNNVSECYDYSTSQKTYLSATTSNSSIWVKINGDYYLAAFYW